MTPREKQIALVRGKLSAKVTSLFSADPLYRAAMAKRSDRSNPHHRALSKATGRIPARFPRWAWSPRGWHSLADDPLKERAPGAARERFVLEIFEKSLRRAGFRRPSGGNKTVTTFVPPGQAGVKVELGSVRKKGSGWWRTTTARHWRVSIEILKVPQTREDGSRFDGKHLWLAPDIRVRQGRGVDLVVERRHGGKWEVSKSSGDWVEGQGWKANWR
jgi:hypothetical protein